MLKTEVDLSDENIKVREESRKFNLNSRQIPYTGRLLISESPLQVLPSLAAKIGLNEAVVLQQIHYWISNELNKNVIDGRRWVYNTYQEWRKQFPFWGLNTIIRAIESLQKKKLLLVGSYNKSASDRTKWYTIDYQVLECLDIGESTQNGYMDLPKMGSSNYPEWVNASTQNGYMDLPKMGSSITRDYIPETISEITKEKTNKKTFAREFEEFWAINPKKVDKPKAREVFNRLLEKDYGNFQKIMDGRRAQNAVIEFEGTETRFIKGPESWLKNRRFEDEVLTQEQLHEQRQRNIQAEGRRPARMSKADIQYNINAQLREKIEREERQLEQQLATVNAEIRRDEGIISEFGRRSIEEKNREDCL